MICPRCKATVADKGKFCTKCGALLQENEEIKKSIESRQPTKALVIEGFGILMFFYVMLVSLSDSYDAKKFIEDGVGTTFVMIGLFLIGIAFIIFRKFKKNFCLTGLGYAGYVLACIGMVFIIIVLIFTVLSLLVSVALFSLL